ncbi:ABC transporter ATP-binding protein [Alicyclobacillus dauci]|uniref:ABC transporter ATP-binding protein n=1 Tax=Alicyclobacillus dauci TaxID=1475485 RepID=A0ABY6Z2V3_9BACL|nr:ABC transporter ATP-binding protein [Alicyclobacillus dauci]WAH37223.1 ABC transporter ATP-binding protein [Alicyclobacillus dauci]
MGVLLQARGLCRKYGDMVAVDHVDLTICEGEIVALLGPNGAGKSTTMKMLTTLLEPSAGEISYLSHPVPQDLIEAKKLFGFVADQPMILPYVTGWEYIQFIGGLYGFSQRDIEARAMPLVERFRLTESIHKRATGYSHGMQQKLALIAQLVHRPRVLIADEPTVGLDPASAAEMQAIFREHAAAGNGILLSTHLLDMANTLATRIIIMMKGRIVAEGTPEELANREFDSLQSIFLRLTGEPTS